MKIERADGGPAFPGVHDKTQSWCEGMTLRDWFAGQALAGMNASLTTAQDWPSRQNSELMASVAYQQADAMLAERAKAEGRS